jgi:hypothetical protein
LIRAIAARPTQPNGGSGGDSGVAGSIRFCGVFADRAAQHAEDVVVAVFAAPGGQVQKSFRAHGPDRDVEDLSYRWRQIFAGAMDGEKGMPLALGLN